MKLIEQWKEAYKLRSVQLALVFAAWQWWEIYASGGLPTDITGWINALAGLVIVVARVLSQGITDKPK